MRKLCRGGSSRHIAIGDSRRSAGPTRYVRPPSMTEKSRTEKWSGEAPPPAFCRAFRRRRGHSHTNRLLSRFRGSAILTVVIFLSFHEVRLT
jgi:hypothetical protein